MLHAIRQSVSQLVHYMNHMRCRKHYKRDRERERMVSIKSGTGMCDVMT